MVSYDSVFAANDWFLPLFWRRPWHGLRRLRRYAVRGTIERVIDSAAYVV